MNIYHYDATTSVYISTTTAFEDPLNPGSYITPANATTVVVPTIPSGQQAVFNSLNSSWELQDIPASTPSSSTPLVGFENMTFFERLNHYGLGDLTTRITGLAELAKKVDTDADIASLQSQITTLQTQVNALASQDVRITTLEATSAAHTSAINTLQGS